MAGVNPRMIEAAGAVADGLVGHPLFTPEYVREVVRPALARGAERAGRDTPPPIAGYVTTSVGEDREAARRDAAAIIAFNSTVKTYRARTRSSGFEREARRDSRGVERGRLRGHGGAVTDEMIDAIALAGTPDEVRERFAERWDGVYERTLLWPPAYPRRPAVNAAIEAFSWRRRAARVRFST